MTITNIIDQVAESLPATAFNDLPMIRQAMNDAVDIAVKSGEMNEQQANRWSQDRAVNAIVRVLKAKRIWEKENV